MSYFHIHGNPWIGYGYEDRTNGAYGSRYPSGHRSNRDETALDTPNRRGSGHGFYSSFGSDSYHGRHHYHPYTRSDKGYLPYESKKSKPPTFDTYLKKMEDAKAWYLGMKNFFELHDYTKNMKAKIVIFSLKEK